MCNHHCTDIYLNHNPTFRAVCKKCGTVVHDCGNDWGCMLEVSIDLFKKRHEYHNLCATQDEHLAQTFKGYLEDHIARSQAQ